MTDRPSGDVAQRIARDPSLPLVSYTERGWFGHQDVIAVTGI